MSEHSASRVDEARASGEVDGGSREATPDVVGLATEATTAMPTTAPLTGHGLQATSLRGFGYGCPAMPPPPWIDVEPDVLRRLFTKVPDSEVNHLVWWHVVQVVRECRALDPWEDTGPESVGVCAAFLAAVEAKVMLPDSPQAPVDVEAPGVLGAVGSMQAVHACLRAVYSAADRLTTAIDDREWVDPRALAGWLDDVVVALRWYDEACRAAASGGGWGQADAGSR